MDVRIGAIRRRRREKSSRKHTREGQVRALLQELCPGHSFESVRPDWIKNPRTGKNLELDCYAPRLVTAEFPAGLAVEVQGIHHHKYCSWIHDSEADFEEYQWRDHCTREACKKKGVRLIETPNREHTPDRDLAGWLANKIGGHLKAHVDYLTCSAGPGTRATRLRS